AVANHVAELAVRGRVLEAATAQIHARHPVAALAVTDDAAARVEPRAVLDVGLLVLPGVLRLRARRARRRDRCAYPRRDPRRPPDAHVLPPGFRSRAADVITGAAGRASATSCRAPSCSSRQRQRPRPASSLSATCRRPKPRS